MCPAKPKIFIWPLLKVCQLQLQSIKRKTQKKIETHSTSQQ